MTEAVAALESCSLCHHQCRVNRRTGQVGKCCSGDVSRVFRYYVSYAEELELTPALMIYLAGCNLRCRFCTQAPACYRAEVGSELTAPQTLAGIAALAREVRWINLVGGEPSLHPHAIVALRRQIDEPVGWLLNTNGYFTKECFELIDPLLDLYVLDIKFGTDGCADSLASAPGYVQHVRRNARTIYATDPRRLLIRHLLLPGHFECCFEPVARWAAADLPDARFHLLVSYVPGPQVLGDPELGRTVPVSDVRRAERLCRSLDLNLVE